MVSKSACLAVLLLTLLFLNFFVFMKTLSRWASRHAFLAILIIVCCEVLNAFNGLLLGLNLLKGWPLGSLLLLFLALLGGAILVRTRFSAGQTYAANRLFIFGAFLGNFFLFGVLGGLWTESIETPDTSRAVFGYRQEVSQSDSLIKPKNRRSNNQADYYADRTERDRAGNQTGKRILYVLLFLAGISLAGLAAGLACNLVCTGYGVGAFFVLLLGTGIFLASFLVLSRAFGKVIKPWREMDRRERGRTWLRALYLFLGFWALTALLGAVGQ